MENCTKMSACRVNPFPENIGFCFLLEITLSKFADDISRAGYKPEAIPTINVVQRIMGKKFKKLNGTIVKFINPESK